MKKQTKPGDMFNSFQKKKQNFKAKKGKKKGGLRSADAVVKSEQNASHQFYKKRKKSKKKVDIGKGLGEAGKMMGKAVKGAGKVGSLLGGMGKALGRNLVGKDAFTQSNSSKGTSGKWKKHKK